MTKKELITRVMHIPNVSTQEQAEAVVTAVFITLRDRLTPGEADDVWAELPTDWKVMWESGNWWEKLKTKIQRMNKLDREEFMERVQSMVPRDIPAEQAVRVVFHALKEQIAPGEVEDVSAQLPQDLRTLWKAA